MVPYFKGTSYAGVAATTGQLVIPFTTGFFPASAVPEEYDFLILAVESANETVATPSGWTQFTNGDYYSGSGTAGGTGATRLSIFYRFYDPATPSVTIEDSGAHQCATVLVFKGVDATSPLDPTGTGSNITHIPFSQTAVSFPDVYVNYANSLVVNILSNGVSTNSSLFSGATNSNLSSLTEVFDYNSTTGVGGGLTVLTGVKSTTGWSGSTTGTLSSTALQGLASIVLKPSSALKMAAKETKLTLGRKFNILRYSKSTSRVSTIIENFNNTPPASSSGTPNWNSTQAILSNVSGKWKIEPSSASNYSSTVSRSFVLNNYEELSFDYTTVNVGATTISVTININTNSGTFYDTYNLPSNSTGSVTYNLNNLRNTKDYNFIESSINLQFRLQGTPIGSGSYLLIDNLAVISNQQNILISDASQYTVGSNNTGLYYNKTVQAVYSDILLTSTPASLYARKALSADTSLLSIGSPSSNIVSDRKLLSDTYNAAISLKSNTMYKGIGLIADTSSLSLTLKSSLFARVYKIVSDTRSLILGFPDTNTVMYPPTAELVVTLNSPTILIEEPPHILVPTLELTAQPVAGFYYFYTITFSGSPVPSTHIIDAKQLEADAYVDLFEIALADNAGTLYLKMNKTVEWQGNIYEGTGIQIDGVASYSDDEVSRPKLSIWNPEGVFSYLVDKGTLEGATVSRIRVLKYDIDNNLPVFRRERWKLSRVVSLKKPSIVCELRDMMDGQNFLTPGRMFIPPEFKTVSLS